MGLIDEQLSFLKSNVNAFVNTGQISEPDARNVVFNQAMGDAVSHGSSPEAVYNNYPQPVKDYFEYTFLSFELNHIPILTKLEYLTLFDL